MLPTALLVLVARSPTTAAAVALLPLLRWLQVSLLLSEFVEDLGGGGGLLRSIAAKPTPMPVSRESPEGFRTRSLADSRLTNPYALRTACRCKSETWKGSVPLPYVMARPSHRSRAVAYCETSLMRLASILFIIQLKQQLSLCSHFGYPASLIAGGL
ncbi:uncharacterized protein LOC125218196 isoform X2 [Salvia hispanica]|uniref:uncharacterized protein LOC125199064 isoform X2 n=1 Tax=Salvia hispanica TaxID=49212 RepID=UPI0020098DBD|nr:uncharacterized protein LOC125199064 isoform X2 [Salvia hispanica]XP_047975778.1 uncharacterized protein LOC125218196 isoform X2 [Salvia hispanica]